MTNAEKFKEMFGFSVLQLGARDNEYRMYCIDAEGNTICDECPLKDKGCNEDAFAKWWQSEYKEPKTDVEIAICQDLNCEKCKYVHRCDYGKGLIKDAQHGRNAMKRLVEINNAKWQKAIEAIKKEIESEQKGYDEWLETALDIIDKHTKELM